MYVSLEVNKCMYPNFPNNKSAFKALLLFGRF